MHIYVDHSLHLYFYNFSSNFSINLFKSSFLLNLIPLACGCPPPPKCAATSLIVTSFERNLTLISSPDSNAINHTLTSSTSLNKFTCNAAAVSCTPLSSRSFSYTYTLKTPLSVKLKLLIKNPENLKSSNDFLYNFIRSPFVSTSPLAMSLITSYVDGCELYKNRPVSPITPT